MPRSRFLPCSHIGPFFSGLKAHPIAPSFSSDPIKATNATESYAYNHSLADNVSDPSNTALTFAKDSGPEWLTIASNGGLTGTPSNSDVGENTFQVHVTNEIGLFDIARMTIDVDNVYSGTQGMEDLLGFAAQWLKTDCIDTPACDGADLNDDNDVNIIDFAILAYNWIIE